SRALGAREDHADLHRARHGYRLQDRAEDLGSLLWPPARRGHTRRDPHQPSRDRSLSRHVPCGGRLVSARPIVRVEGLDVFYGKSQILFGVGLELKQGQTLALLGRNGAGKSTTMKAIAGVAPPRRGIVDVAGTNVAGRAPYAIARTGIGFVPEDRQI